MCLICDTHCIDKAKKLERFEERSEIWAEKKGVRKIAGIPRIKIVNTDNILESYGV